MSADADEYEDRLEIMLMREYTDLARIFRYIVITAERTYMCNEAKVTPVATTGQVYFKVDLADAWVWDGHLPTRFIDRAEVYTFSDVNVEELKRELM